MKTREDILDLIEEEDVEFIRLQFTDVFGNLKNIAITPGQLQKSLVNNFEIDASALFDGQIEYGEDLYLKPDLNTFVILPWRPQHGKVGKFICDVVDCDGKLFDMSPRTVLKRVLDEARELGYTFSVNPRCEFFLFNTDDNGNPTTISHEKAGYLDVGPLDFGENARRDMVLTLEEMGFEIESSHHEKTSAQHAIEFSASEALEAADSLMTFKFAVRSIAKRFGLYATFMPKPRTDLNGSAMHISFTVMKDGENIFGGDAMSEAAKQFIAGVLAHTAGMCAITNPTVNSYKRILADRGALAPIGWSTKNERQTVTYRGRGAEKHVIARFPDTSANPYLAFAACIAAGLDGIKNGLKLLEQGEPTGEYLPVNLKDALRKFDADAFIKSSIGEEFAKTYSSLKEAEWNDYMEQVSDWEVSRYLGKM